MNITFDKQESDKRTSSGWNWFYGTAEVNGKEYPFSLCEMNTKVGGQNTTATEITWSEETPPSSQELENKIEEVFEKEF
jgi:hypothetical protein